MERPAHVHLELHGKVGLAVHAPNDAGGERVQLQTHEQPWDSLRLTARKGNQQEPQSLLSRPLWNSEDLRIVGPKDGWIAVLEDVPNWISSILASDGERPVSLASHSILLSTIHRRDVSPIGTGHLHGTGKHVVARVDHGLRPTQR